MKTSLILLKSTAAALALGCYPVMAEQGSVNRQADNRQAQRESQSLQSMSQNMRGTHASELLGRDIRTPQDEDLGQLSDFVIDAQSGKVLYAVVASGGVVGIGQTLRAVPVTALKQSSSSGSEQMLINIDQAKWDQAPTFEKNQLASLSHDQRGQELHQYYGQTAPSRTQPSSRTQQGVATQGDRQTTQGAAQLVLATDIIGQDVRSGSQEVGSVEDVIIQLRSRSAAALLDPADSLADANRSFLVPFNKLTRDNEGNLSATLSREDFANASQAPDSGWGDQAVGYVSTLFVWPAQNRDDQTRAGSSDRMADNGIRDADRNGSQPPVAAVRQAVQAEARSADGPTSVAVAANGDKVVLSGTVPTEDVKERIEERAEQAAQGWDIDNQIRVAQRR